jgi:ribonuclease P protein component
LSPEGLPRSWRLTRSSDITETLRAGRRRRTARLDIFWRENQLGHPRFTVVVPRFGYSAVARHRLRRRLRETIRRHLLRALAPMDFVVRSREPAYQVRFEACVSDLDAWLRSVSA